MKRLFAALVATLHCRARATRPIPSRSSCRSPPAARSMRSRAFSRPSWARACKPMSWWRISAVRAACSRLTAPPRAPPDGRTILFASVGAFVITNALKPKPGYEQLKTFAPVARVGAAPTLFIVKADSPIKSLPDLIAKAKGGDKLSYGSAGNGTTMHIVAEQLNASAGTKITHVPYRGIAPALNDIMGKHIDFLNGDITVLYPLVQQGTIRALAVAGNERAKLLPDVPTVGEAGFKNVYMENWYGALVPAATPPDVVAKLEAAIMDVLKTPAVWDKISANGVYGPQDAKAFRAQIEKDVAYWGAEIKRLGIQVE